MRLVVGLVILVALHAPAAAAGWTIQWPTGWTNVTETFLGQPEIQAQLGKVKDLGGTATAVVYSADDGTLLVFETRMPASDRGALDDFEAGARDSVRARATEVKYEKSEETTALVVDHVVDVGGQRRIVRRVTGFADGIVSVSAMCVTATPQTCETALRSLTVDRGRFTPLANLKPRGLVDENSTPYRVGRMLGFALIAGIGGWLVWSLLKRRRAARDRG